MKNRNLYKCVIVLLSVCLLISQGCGIVGASSTIVEEEAKLSANLEMALQRCDEEDRISVYIWSSDIDQYAVESAVEAKLGYSRDDLLTESLELTSQNSAMPALSSLSMHDYSFEQSVQQYIQATASARKKAQERVNRYVAERRQIAKAAYIAQNQELVAQMDLQESELVFVSQYSPMIIANLSSSQIFQVESLGMVNSIGLCADSNEVCGDEVLSAEDVLMTTSVVADSYKLDAMRSSYGIDTIHNAFGLTGDSVKIGICEDNHIMSHDELPSDRFTIVGNIGTSSNHATSSARVCAGNRGIAKEATVYSCGDQVDENNPSDTSLKKVHLAYELLLDQNVTVINYSMAFSYFTFYDDFDKWIDHIAAVHGVTVVVSAGNIYPVEQGSTQYTEPIVSRPSDAYNVISVGAYDGKLNTNTEDDALSWYSCYLNGNGVEKPDLVAPADYALEGTSTAAPFVSGVVALMMELQPALSLQPHMVKAILMASCQRKVITNPLETMPTIGTALTEKQGAGAIDPVMAMAIVSAGNYGFGEMAVGDSIDEVRFQQPAYSSDGMTVALTWLHETEVNEEELTQGAPTLSAVMPNMALAVVQNSATIALSNCNNSSTEFVCFTPTPENDVYTLYIQKEAESYNEDDVVMPVRYAYAWAVTDQQFQYRHSNQGIYYIKNQSNQQYLGADTSEGSLTQTGMFSATETYQWLLQRNNDAYRLWSGSGSGMGVARRATLIDGVYAAALQPDTASETVTIIPNDNGTYSFVTTVDGVQYALSAVRDSMSVQWSLYDADASAQRWRFENCSYRNGDINTDGYVNTQDSDLLTSYTGGAITLNKRQLAFADINGDGVVNMTDAFRLLAFINNHTEIL